MLNNDLSQMNFGFLEGVQGALHLDLTHNGKAPAAEAMYLKTNQFHVQQFAYLVEADEGDRRGRAVAAGQFDADVLLEPVRRRCASAPTRCRSTCGQGRRDAEDRVACLDYLDKGDDNRRACSLYFSLMDRMGVKLDRFGDTDKRLVDL